MAENEICGTKDPTFHRLLLDTRFELPLGLAFISATKIRCVYPNNVSMHWVGDACVVRCRYPRGGGQILGQETWTTKRHERPRCKKTVPGSSAFTASCTAVCLSKLSLFLPHSLIAIQGCQEQQICQFIFSQQLLFLMIISHCRLLLCLQYAYQEEQERPLHAPTTQCCKLTSKFLGGGRTKFSSVVPRPLLCSATSTHDKEEAGHVAEMRLMDEVTRGGRESRCDKPSEPAHVNSRVTCTVGDSCVTDDSWHALPLTDCHRCLCHDDGWHRE